jgi:hypothetical protein
MKNPIPRTAAFVLGGSATVGALIALSVAAFAGGELSIAAKAAAPARATDVLPSFSRARTADDALPPSAREALARLLGEGAPTEALDPGTSLPGDSRRTVTAHGQTMYLVPTDKGLACYVLTPSGDAGCTDGSAIARDGVDWSFVDPDGLGVGAPTVVHGLTGANVAGINVAAGTMSRPAVVQDGAFYVEFHSKPTAIIVRFADGSAKEITIPAPPAP